MITSLSKGASVQTSFGLPVPVGDLFIVRKRRSSTLDSASADPDDAWLGFCSETRERWHLFTVIQMSSRASVDALTAGRLVRAMYAIIYILRLVEISCLMIYSSYITE